MVSRHMTKGMSRLASLPLGRAFAPLVHSVLPIQGRPHEWSLWNWTR